jgi:hypothetical protein
MAAKFVVDGELTEEAMLTPELIEKCTFSVGAASLIKVDDEKNKPKAPPTSDHYQKFIEIGYPNGEKSASAILPECVVHCDIHDYFGKSSAYVGVPQTIVAPLKAKLVLAGENPTFQDKRILSDSKYWWFRVQMVDAPEGKEKIRTSDRDGELYFSNYTDFFTDVPAPAIANITCSLKLKTDIPVGTSITGNEIWRGGIQVSMITPYDVTDVEPPSSGTGQRSIAGKKDLMRPGLAKFLKGR